jgi:predicted nucleic acid-binding protein
VLVGGARAFRNQYIPGENRSADVIYKWIDEDAFEWLITSDIVKEYSEILNRRKVRSAVIGRIINLLREQGTEIVVDEEAADVSPDPEDNEFIACAEQGLADLILTWNIKDFPQQRLKAKVMTPEAFLTEHCS